MPAWTVTSPLSWPVWNSPTEKSVPAFVTVVAMPFAYSIATGIALGFISYPAVKVLSGRGHGQGKGVG